MLAAGVLSAYCVLRFLALVFLCIVLIAATSRMYHGICGKYPHMARHGIRCSEDVSNNEINTATMDLLREQTECGRQRSFQIAAYLHGQKIVDCWGGCEQHDLFMAFSVSKVTFKFYLLSSFCDSDIKLGNPQGVAAAAVALCAGSGTVDYTAKVSSYWPKFGNNGKENITVEDAISHRSGLNHEDMSPLLSNLFTW